jgi:uncharacterized iron-regulated membrane protein
MKSPFSLRRTVFWLHLLCGVAAGLVILVMSVTGVLISFERQILESSDIPALSTSSGPKFSIEQLLEKARETTPDKTSLTSLTLTRDTDKPAVAVYGRDITAYLDTATGQVLAPRAPALRRFFTSVTDLHRALAFSGDSRNTGRAITGAANLVFLFLVVSGIYLWFPRKWSWAALKPSLWFRRNLSGRAREWNWHNVFGFWSSIPLFFIVLTGALISYPWATSLLYRLTGNDPPPATQPGGPRSSAPSATLDFHGLNTAWAKAEELSPGWQSISLRLPAAKEAVFTVMAGHRGRPDLRSTLTLDPQNPAGEPKVESFSSFNTGRQLRTWGRWVHTGEAGGLTGQVIAALACMAAVVLVWTGFALAIRRLVRKLRNRNTDLESAPST